MTGAARIAGTPDHKLIEMGETMRRNLLTWTMFAAGVALLLNTMPAAGHAVCIGDCDNTGQVTVGELITMVNIALGNAPVTSCAAGDSDGDGTITVDEILKAVTAALDGCNAEPTPTPTPFVPGTCSDPAVQASEPLCALDSLTYTCDFLIQEHCLLPYPSSVFLKADATTPTGFRMNYPREGMPTNDRGIKVDPTDWNTLDGFSPGAMMEAVFPEGVDMVASNVAPITNMPRSLDADSPTVIINANTGEHILHFAELDVSLHEFGVPPTGMVLIRPGIRLHEATRYIVAIRGLKDPQGNPIAPRHAFQILRDNLDTPVQTINARRPQMEDIFTKLAQAGVARNDLLLAWDFVTASSESLTSRALSTRDQGLAANGPGAPPFTVTSMEGTLDAPYSDQIFRRIRGFYTVPLFMTSKSPPAMFNFDANGVPKQNGTAQAPFTVTIPLFLVTGDGPPRQGRPAVYGHGLLGSGEGEVTAGNLQTLQSKYGFVLGATDWIGLSDNDVPNTLKIIADLSNFRQMPDRLQQAFLNFILLGRLLTAANGFVSDPAFQLNGTPLIDTQELYYYGISQGGIEGGAYLALSPDTQRGVLGVGAENYSTLLQRSTDFSQYQLFFDQHYQDPYERSLLFPIIQQLWDRGEPNGYASHLLTDPLPGTPAKKILMQIGLHDSQVPNLASEIQARSLGIPAVAPSALPLFQVPEMTAPFDGSAFVPYDVSALPEPLTDTPPADDDGVHEAIRRLDAAQSQIDAFLRPDGTVQNFCTGACVFHDVPDVETPPPTSPTATPVPFPTPITCGNTVCPQGQVCCNPVSSLCTPPGEVCS